MALNHLSRAMRERARRTHYGRRSNVVGGAENMMRDAAFLCARSLLEIYDPDYGRELVLMTKEERVMLCLFFAAVLESEGL